MKAIVGLDCSFNNTGICIKTDAKHILIQIASSNQAHSANTVFKTYKRTYAEDPENFSQVDIAKVLSAQSMAAEIINTLSFYKKLLGITEWEFRIEGNLLRARFAWQTTSIAEMTMLNGIIKTYILRITPNVHVIQATNLKKLFTGYGAGKKSNMQEKFLKIFPNFDLTGKTDDIIDAYALAHINI